MKILQLIKTAEGAGWATRQIRELIKMGAEVHVAMPFNGARVDECRSYGAKVHEIDYSLKKIISCSKRLCKIVFEVNPTIIHSHFVLTTIIMRLALREDTRPRIFQVPGPLHLEHAIFRNMDLALAQDNDYWVSSCNWTTNCYLKHGVSSEKLFLSYYGGDFTDKKSNKSGLLHKELNLPSDSILIGMVAYMYAPKRYLGQKRGLKGHEDFIDAIKIVSRKYSNVYGVCVGGAWAGAYKYEQRVVEYGKRTTDHVFFLGTRNDIIDIYADLYCVAHPSHSENLGGAAESLVLGIPTIASDVGGFPDIVINEKTGVLVPPKKPNALAKAIIKMIENPSLAKEFAQNGQVLVHDLLDVRNTAKTLYDVYEKISLRHV